MHDQQITYLSSNQRRTHTVRFLCRFAVNIASNIKASASLSSAIFCCHSRDVRNDACHGSTISFANFLRKLNHAHKSWPTLSIVLRPLKNSSCYYTEQVETAYVQNSAAQQRATQHGLEATVDRMCEITKLPTEIEPRNFHQIRS